MTVILKETTVDIIEEASRYFLIAKDQPEKTIAIGDRDRLRLVCENIPMDMIIATSGTDEKCLVFTDYTTKELNDIIEKVKKLIN